MTLHTLEFIALANSSKDDAMSEKIEWITLNQAEQRADCPVSRQTLHAMIERGDIPLSAIDKRPYGESRTIIFIDANVLKTLPYREPGQRGKAKD